MLVKEKYYEKDNLKSRVSKKILANFTAPIF
jgi:hypothetical protein